MAFNNKSGDDNDIVAEINMTPLIDIMLVLLIIFMVTSSVAVTSGLDISLPQTTKRLKNLDSNSIRISLDKDHKISIQGNIIQFKDLEARLKEALAESENKVVLLEGDESSNLGKTIEIMDLAKKLGAKRFAVAASSK